MNWQCRLGFHHWRPIGRFRSVFDPLPIEQCERCGKGRYFSATTGVTYAFTADQIARWRQEAGSREEAP